MKPKDHLIAQNLLREGLREYFEQYSSSHQENKTPLSKAVDEPLASIKKKPAISFDQPPAAAKPTPSAFPETEDAEDKLLRVISSIIETHYSLRRFPPLSYFNTPGDGSIMIQLFPMPAEAEIRPGCVDPDYLNQDMLQKLELLFEHLEDVDEAGIRLAYDRRTSCFSIHSEDAYSLLYLFENLMLTQDLPCRDTLYFSRVLEKKARMDSGEKCFASRKEYNSYTREAVKRDRALSRGIMDASPEAFMTALPARVFENFEEASRSGMDYMALGGMVPFMDVSFAQLERELDIQGEIDPEDWSELPPLLQIH